MLKKGGCLGNRFLTIIVSKPYFHLKVPAVLTDIELNQLHNKEAMWKSNINLYKPLYICKHESMRGEVLEQSQINF